jgi:hypothetical protein
MFRGGVEHWWTSLIEVAATYLAPSKQLALRVVPLKVMNLQG